jgi:hypothetical protein
MCPHSVASPKKNVERSVRLKMYRMLTKQAVIAEPRSGPLLDPEQPARHAPGGSPPDIRACIPRCFRNTWVPRIDDVSSDSNFANVSPLPGHRRRGAAPSTMTSGKRYLWCAVPTTFPR